jgi:hypothetical protein
MGRHSKTVIEYRSYEFPPHFPLRVIAGEEWRISDVPSGVLHFHNCLEIGICESDSGKMNFSGKVVPFKAGDITFVAGDVPHTTWSDPGCASKWSYIFTDAEELLRPFFDPAALPNSRLLAQVCYYFEAVAQLPKADRAKAVISVPSGNFGNLTAGLIAKALGLPVKRFIAATNANDTVPRYLKTGQWEPHQTVATLSNAMDVSRPNNWPRVEELCRRKGWALETLGSGMRDDAQTRDALKRLHQLDYLCEPHGAIAWDLLNEQLGQDEVGVFLCTAHPAKFKESVDEIKKRIIGQ